MGAHVAPCSAAILYPPPRTGNVICGPLFCRRPLLSPGSRGQSIGKGGRGPCSQLLVMALGELTSLNLSAFIWEIMEGSNS